MSGRVHSWAVDSIEEGIAVVEEDGRRMLQVPAWLLPDGVRDGVVLSVERTGVGDSAAVTVRVDREATARAYQRSRDQLRGPRGHDPGGDIVL